MADRLAHTTASPARAWPFRLTGCLLPAVVFSLPLLGLLTANVPIGGRLLVGAVLALAASRPPDALLVVAGLTPLGGVLGAMAGMPMPLTEPLVLAFLTGWLAREAVRPGARVTTRCEGTLVPVVLMAAAGVASAIVWTAARQPFVAYPVPFLQGALRFTWSNYLLDRNSYAALTSGMELLEGLSLFAAALVLSNRQAGLSRRLVGIIVAAGTGVAALSVNRMVTIALRGIDPWDAWCHFLPRIRISAAFADFNAAGSYFAMLVCPAAAFLVSGSARRWLWALPLSLLLFALWLTGSRAALLALPAAGLVAMVLMPAVRARLTFWRRVTLIGVLVAALVTAWFLSVRAPGRVSARGAASVRMVLAEAGIRMTSSHPVFGVGVGRFKDASIGYIPPESRAILGAQNAHNNLLQLLAELGLAGFLPFVWLLAMVGRQAWPGGQVHRVDALAVAVPTGIVAFLLTCLAGHPLLIREVACAFWLTLGSCAHVSGAPLEEPPASGRRRRWWLTAAAVVSIFCTIPFRVDPALAECDLEHAAIGLSTWQVDPSGAPARRMVGPTAQFFIPANGPPIRLRFLLEAAAGGDTSAVTILVDRQVVSRVVLRAGDAVEPSMILRGRGVLGFRRIELRREGAGGAKGSVWVGMPPVRPEEGQRRP